jgi:endonuclease/exonuclease/phosphatase family metal-dependent hydrolase
MEVVVWNMNHRVKSWQGLSELEADVALLSEARVPKDIGIQAQGGQRTEGRDKYPRSWGAAIVSKHELRPIADARALRYGKPLNLPFETSRPGTWEAALVLRGNEAVTVVSVYGLLDEKSDASVHRSLSELSPIFEDPRYKRSLLLGGDLNIWTGRSVPGAQHLDRHQVVIERVMAYGLIDCLLTMRPRGPLEGCPCQLGADCTHTWTKVDPRYPGVAYQDDYLFASASMAKRLRKCVALDPREWSAYSDHSPIVARFED